MDGIYAGRYDNLDVIGTKTEQWTLPDVVSLQRAAKGRDFLPTFGRRDRA
jgi:hypothetical protein